MAGNGQRLPQAACGLDIRVVVQARDDGRPHAMAAPLGDCLDVRATDPAAGNQQAQAAERVASASRRACRRSTGAWVAPRGAERRVRRIGAAERRVERVLRAERDADDRARVRIPGRRVTGGQPGRQFIGQERA
jgi:hypothetical protein